MKKMFFPMLVLVVTSALAETPVIRPETVVFGNLDGSPDVSLQFKLEGEPAIVTLDILTNGVSIGARLFRDRFVRRDTGIGGVFGHVIEPAEYDLVWKAGENWPGYRFKKGEVDVRLTAWSLDKPPLYMAVDILTNTNLEWFASEDEIPGGAQAALYKDTSFLMRRIPAGNAKFLQGVGRTEAGRPSRYTTLSNDYYIGVFPVTQEQYWQVAVKAGAYPTYIPNPSPSKYNSSYALTEEESAAGLKTGWRPVDGTVYETYLRGTATSYDWPNNGHDVSPNHFFGVLRTRTGLMFDLPTEAQWEFAARAGSDTKWSYGNTFDAAYAWYKGNADGKSHPVGCKLPNSWGLYDMNGHLYEWVLDWSPGTISDEPVEDPDGATGRQPWGVWTLNREVKNSPPSQLEAGTAPCSINDIGATAAGKEVTFRLWCPVSVRSLFVR